MEYIIKHDEEHGDILIPKVEKILCAAIWYKDYFKPVHSCINMYVHRIDWLLSGDDGENDFIERLKEELKELED